MTSAQVISLGELHADTSRMNAASLAPTTSPLLAVRARLQARIGEIEISIAELMSVKEHQVLRLDCCVDDPVDLVLEGKTVARGQLVAIEGYFGIRITELPIPLRP